jgi:hypothetical protein
MEEGEIGVKFGWEDNEDHRDGATQLGGIQCREFSGLRLLWASWHSLKGHQKLR